MPDIDLDRPLFTKRGGVVTELKNDDSDSYPYQGYETKDGIKKPLCWTGDGMFRNDSIPDPRDLTNTPPADYVAPEPSPVASDELSELRAENKQLARMVAHLELEVSRMHAINQKLCKIGAK